MTNSSAKAGTVAIFVLLAVMFTAGAVLYFHDKNTLSGMEALRSAERIEIKAAVEREQNEIFSRIDMKRACEEEAVRILSEQPSPVQDAVQRARPLPLIPSL